jgi:hypothetical protein
VFIAVIVAGSLASVALSALGMARATIRPAPGWVVAGGGAGNPSLVVAVSAGDVAAVRPVALFGSFKRLSSRGILVWVSTDGRGRAGFPARKVWPPRLRGFKVERGWEGQPALNIQQRVWVGSVRGWDLDVRVFFGTQRPSRSLLAQAQRELGRLHLP